MRAKRGMDSNNNNNHTRRRRCQCSPPGALILGIIAARCEGSGQKLFVHSCKAIFPLVAGLLLAGQSRLRRSVLRPTSLAPLPFLKKILLRSADYPALTAPTKAGNPIVSAEGNRI